MEFSNQTSTPMDALDGRSGDFIELLERGGTQKAPVHQCVLHEASRSHRLYLRNWDHQFCLWGHDIKAPGRDFLRLYGFKKTPKQTDFSNSPTYLETNRRELSFDLCLWAFGAYLSVPNQGIWAWSRHSLRLKLAPGQHLEDPWCLMKEPRLARDPSVEELRRGMPYFREFVGWMARYEGWIQDGFSSRHRKKAEPLATNLRSYWQDVASNLCVAHRARLPRIGIL